MSAPAVIEPAIAELGWDERRGTRAMALFIATEAALFVVLFFSYFYLAAGKSQWPSDGPPKLKLALTMLVVLLASSAVAFAAEKFAAARRIAAARAAIGLTLLLGVAFLVLQFFEYRDHMHSLRLGSDAYGSVFYTITSIHGLHVLLGLLMLAYATALPRPEHAEKPPFRALHNAALYWHFVDFVWIVIVVLLYLLPHWRAAS